MDTVSEFHENMNTTDDILQAVRAVHDVTREDTFQAVRAVHDVMTVELKTLRAEMAVLEQAWKKVEAILKSLPIPVINVEVPPPRLTEKTFSYDQHGRPATVVEKEIKEK